MPKQKHIRSVFLISATLVTVISMGVVAVLWLWEEQESYKADVARIQHEKMEQHKRTLRREVDAAVDYIEFKRLQTEARTEATVKERTYEAYEIASHIYAAYKDRVPLEELKQLVRETLRPIRFNNGRGYYFATAMDGTEQLFADRPEMEGTNLLDLQDTQGAYVIRDLIALVKEQNEGYYTYTWTKPDTPGQGFRKMSFVKRFEPFDWFIGTGEYLDDVTADLKAEALDWISHVRYGTDGYIFAGQWDGLSLSGPARGQNMINTVDPNGVRIVQELIERARGDGGFVSYVMPRLEGQRPAPKISYAKGIKAWEWYVGTGAYVDDVEKAVQVERARILGQVRFNGIFIALALVLLLAVSYVTAKRTSRRLSQAFGAFSEFFQKAARESVEVSSEHLGFVEFARLADSANAMVRERRRADAERARLAEQLRHSQKMEAVGQLAGGIAHEFNNLLQVIAGYTEMTMLDLAKNEAAQANLTEVRRAAERAAGLTRQLLVFSRREPLKAELFEIDDVVRRSARMLRQVIGEHVELSIREGPGSKVVAADSGQIEQILMNLSINSRDAMPQGGTITIETARIEPGEPVMARHGEALPGAYVMLAVSDTGCGIPDRVRDRIFEPFVTTKEAGSGTGLGLATVYAIVKRHEGFVEWDSEIGRGSVFRVYLPAAGASAAPAGDLESSEVAGGDETILLAEDDEAVRELAVKLLTHAGYNLLVAGDGDEAVRLAEQHAAEIDLVLLDVVMPKRGGRAVFEAVKRINPGIPVLFTSGYSYEHLPQAPGAAEDWEVLRKPYTTQQLLLHVRKALERRPKRP